MSNVPGDPAPLGLGDQGYTVADGVLSPDDVTQSIAALEEVFAAEADVAEDRGWSTESHRIAFALPLKHRWFLTLVEHQGLIAIARRVLGAECVIAAFNGFSPSPGGGAQRLHRDHPEATPPHAMFVHLVVALDPFTATNGATRLVPGSHRLATHFSEEGSPSVLPDPGLVSDLEADAVTVEVPSGGVVAYDGALFHAGGANTSDGPRRALHVFFARRWVRPHWDFPASFSAEAAADLTPLQRQLLGFDSRPATFDLSSRTASEW